MVVESENLDVHHRVSTVRTSDHEDTHGLGDRIVGVKAREHGNILAVTAVYGVVARPAVQGVVAGPAHEVVGPLKAEQSIVPSEPRKRIVLRAADQGVVTRGTDEVQAQEIHNSDVLVVEPQSLYINKSIGAVRADDRHETPAHICLILREVACKYGHVIACGANQKIIAEVAGEDVVAVETDQCVSSGRTRDGVRLRSAHDFNDIDQVRCTEIKIIGEVKFAGYEHILLSIRTNFLDVVLILTQPDFQEAVSSQDPIKTGTARNGIETREICLNARQDESIVACTADKRAIAEVIEYRVAARRTDNGRNAVAGENTGDSGECRCAEIERRVDSGSSDEYVRKAIRVDDFYIVLKTIQSNGGIRSCRQNTVEAIASRHGIEALEAGVEEEGIVSTTAVERVVTRPAGKRVHAPQAGKRVVSFEAGERIVPLATDQDIGPAGSDEVEAGRDAREDVLVIEAQALDIR